MILMIQVPVGVFEALHEHELPIRPSCKKLLTEKMATQPLRVCGLWILNSLWVCTFSRSLSFQRICVKMFAFWGNRSWLSAFFILLPFYWFFSFFFLWLLARFWAVIEENMQKNGVIMIQLLLAIMIIENN